MSIETKYTFTILFAHPLNHSHNGSPQVKRIWADGELIYDVAAPPSKDVLDASLSGKPTGFGSSIATVLGIPSQSSVFSCYMQRMYSAIARADKAEAELATVKAELLALVLTRIEHDYYSYCGYCLANPTFQVIGPKYKHEPDCQLVAVVNAYGTEEDKAKL